MSVEPGRRDYPLAARRRAWAGFVPAWWLRLRLRHLCAEIDSLERRLADEFGLAETAPMHRELEALCAARDALMKRLAARP